LPTLAIFTNDIRKYTGEGPVRVGKKDKGKKPKPKNPFSERRKKLGSKTPYDNSASSVLFSNEAKYIQQEGKQYLVVPGIPVQEQVMNTYLLPAEEIERSLNDWNGTPLAIGHPKQNGGSVQVEHPDVPIIGKFQNATWDPEKKRMSGEYWIDISEAMNYPDGQAIMNAIRSGQMLETSTAYWADEDWISGTFKNRSYTSVHRNPKRDHIAIFPGSQLGACSIKDGCGLNRNMQHNCNCIHHNKTGTLSGEGKALWEKVYNSSKQKGDSEETAAKKAWAAVKNAGWHQKKGDWVKKNQQDGYPEYKPNHLPTAMLVGFAFDKGMRMKEDLDGTRTRMEKNGITSPVWVQCYEEGKYRILDGNHRVHIADELGIEQIPVRVVNSHLMEVDPEAVYREWLHEQDQGYLS
jgi:hypothetical protein